MARDTIILRFSNYAINFILLDSVFGTQRMGTKNGKICFWHSKSTFFIYRHTDVFDYTTFGKLFQTGRFQCCASKYARCDLLWCYVAVMMDRIDIESSELEAAEIV